MSFRDHNESVESANQGKYLELFYFLIKHNEEVQKVTFENASTKLQLTSPKVQKEICQATVAKTLVSIITKFGEFFFSIIVDESRDVSTKE